ncbi:MAG: hypothetical protein PW788_03005 [Micavibrio sp.]|nr:hypothetical protein [Micavibrio sp.]
MKKTSDILASRIGKVVLGLGLTAAVLSPVAGAIIGGWSTATAAASAMGIAAAIPLAGAGLFGGFVIGSVAMPFVAIGAVIAAGVAAVTTKGISSLFDKSAPATAGKPDVQRFIRLEGSSRVAGLTLGRHFDAALKQKTPRNDNTPKPAPSKRWTFGL